jgi:LCP family protein required for cell wall assembly
MRLRNHPIVIFILCVHLVACSAPGHAGMPNHAITQESIPTFRPDPTTTITLIPASTQNFSITPTIEPVPTNTPTPGFAWGDFPGPTEDSEMEIPPPVPLIQFPQKTVNILLLGTDRRSSWTYYQTDAVVILSLDPEANNATLISIPRDLYVYIPGWKVNRINTAEFKGGFEMIANTVLYNLGIPVDHYMKVEYQGFKEAIDILGGIDVRTTGRVKDMCEGIAYEYEPDVVYHLDGFDAMCYVRMRMKSSDFDRLRRQQDVFLAMLDKFISIDGFLKVPQLYDTFSQIVETDMALDDLLPLLPLAGRLALDPSRIQFFRIDYSMVEDWRTPESRAAVLLPDRELIQAMLKETYRDLGDSASPGS